MRAAASHPFRLQQPDDRNMPAHEPGDPAAVTYMVRLGLLLSLALARLSLAGAHAQDPNSPTLRIEPLLEHVDSARSGMPASHRSAAEHVDRPVVRLHCPPALYPTALYEHGLEGRVVFRFVVDTLGLVESDDMVVVEAANAGFIRAARRVVARCRYRPAERLGRPVRSLVQQGVGFRRDSPQR
jgi:outer membrane biosynthesis protein TonB